MASTAGEGSWDITSYSKVLLLGAIAAASAFVVTIVIVLACVGCQRKSKSKHPPADGETGSSVDTSTLRNPKLNSMSKSDTRLHEINRMPCNGAPKNRPASMDLLLLHSRRSQPELRPSHVRQLPQIPTSPQGGSKPGEGRDHTYTEVGLRTASLVRCLDDGLYESVGVRDPDGDPKMPPPPPPTSANTPATLRAARSPLAQGNGARNANGNGHGNEPSLRSGPGEPSLRSGPGEASLRSGPGEPSLRSGPGEPSLRSGPGEPSLRSGPGEPSLRSGPGELNGTVNSRGKPPPAGVNGSPLSSLPSLALQDPVTAEYASIRKVRKVDKATKKDNNGEESDSQSSVGESPSAPPPQLPRIQEISRKQLESFHLPPFPKEAVFMGNGEQYIWKPPEEDDIITLHPVPAHQGHMTATEVSDTYSTVCKTLKKKVLPEINAAKTLPRCPGGDGGSSSRGNGWAASSGGAQGRGRGAQTRSQEEPCYEPVGERSWPVADADPAYATIDSHRRRERAGSNNGVARGSATLKPRKPLPQQAATGPPQGPPGLPPPPGPPAPTGPPAPPVRAHPGGENFYEAISDVKQGANSSSTTTIFTFNDGMEMYVTGL